MSSERKATVTYTGDGSQTKYSFPFDYLRKAFVKVHDISGDNIKNLVLGTDYSIDDKQVSLAKPIPSGDHLKIYRQTTTEPLVEWQDASVLRSADLSLQEVQLLHLSEETLDRVQEGGLSTDPQDSDVWDARFKRMKNLLDPKEDGDAVTLRYINNSRDGIIGAITTTGDTQIKRVTTTGDTQDARVVSTGNKYVETMTGLKDVATTKASESADSAELSKAWAMSSTSPDNTDSKSSKTWAEEAKGHAGNAKTSETNAKTSETNANSYMTNANAYMTNASGSATKAKTSETNAKTSETNAAKSAEDAKTHAENAAKYDPSELIAKAHHYIKRNTAYNVGDVLTSPNLPYGTIIVVTQAGTTGADEPDWTTINGGVEYTDGNCKYKVKKIATGSGVIPGTILAFSGNFSSDGYPIDKTTGNADTTWHLCDGTNGTPDLRGRFILGSSTSHGVGTTGGEEETGLEIKNLPPHSFSGTTNKAGGHAHDFRGAQNSNDNRITRYEKTDNNSRTRAWLQNNTTNVAGEHAHTFTTNTLGEGVKHNNMPPYYTLAFIMKL